MCNCGKGEETSTHFFLHCPNYSIQRDLLIRRVTPLMEELDSKIIVKSLLGMFDFLRGKRRERETREIRSHIMSHTLTFIAESGRFD